MGRRRLILSSLIIIIVIFFFKILFHLNLDPSNEGFTNADLCPACYGSDLCPQFYHGDISLIGISRLKYFRSSKNVYFAKFTHERVILKKLAHDWELLKSDKFLCHKANLKHCKVNQAMEILLNSSIENTNNYLLKNIVNTFNSSTDIAQCPSERLLSFIFSKLYVKEFNFNKKEFYKLGEMMYSFHLNPEAIILQAFSQAEGWPFPHYYGSCGRVIVEEYVGRTIAYFEDSSWKQRMDIAYQLLLIAQMLTENTSDFALYMTDVSMDNFAVRSDGTVLLIDVESIVIVDRLNTDKDKRFHKIHHSKGEFCKDCLNFSFEDLCQHEKSDHNYYAICKGLLVPGSYYSSKGFLHSIPEKVNFQTNLTQLVSECADPTENYSRFYTVPKLLQVMKTLL